MALIQPAQYRGIYDSVYAASASLTPALVATVTTGVASTITVPGAAVGDLVTVRAPAAIGALILQGEVTAANTVTLKFANTTAGSLTPPAGVYTAVCERLTNLTTT
jgi:antitoxin (DNA-binding transcriptional repressor) of toxin-antitoxin stability system